MRRFLPLFFTFLLTPAVSFGAVANTNAGNQPPCFMTSSANPSGTKTFASGSGTSAASVKSYLQNVIYCPTACYDENIRITIPSAHDSIVFTVTATNKCKDASAQNSQQDNRGCAKGQIQPQITFNVPEISHWLAGVLVKAQQLGPKSRCNAGISDLVNSAFDKISAGNDAGDANLVKSAQNDLNAFNALPTQAPPMENAWTDALMRALTGLGISEPDAKTIAQSAVTAGDLIKALQSNDPDTISDALKNAAKTAGITLNSNLLDDIAHLTPEQAAAKVAALAGIDTGQLGGLAAGFDPPLGQTAPPGGVWSDMYKSIESQYGMDTFAPGGLAMFGKIESGGDPNAISPTGAAGMFQYTGSTWDLWSSKWNQAVNGISSPLPRNLRFDPKVSSEVTAYYMASNWQQHGGLIQQSGMDTNAALYAIHNLGDSGGPGFIQAFAQNPNLPVSAVVRPEQIRYNPVIYGNGNISLAQAQANMLAGMTGSTNFSGRSRAPYNGYMGGGTSNYSPYAMGSPYSYAYGNDPFASAYSGYALARPVSIGSPMTIGVPGSSSGSSQGGQSFAPQDQGFSGSGSMQSSVPQPAATIIAQPASVAKGASVQVSWSSVGMRPDQPCQVFANEVFLFAVGNEGTKFASTTTATSGQHWTFTLKCTAFSGAAIQQAAIVDIR